MAVAVAASRPPRIWILAMKMFLVINAHDLVAQRSLYNAGVKKLISFWFFNQSRAKDPKELMDWLEADVLSIGPQNNSGASG